MGSKGTSRHRKRFAAPLTYPIARKHQKFTIKALPGGHRIQRSIPLSIVLREVLGLAGTVREANHIIRSGAISVDKLVRRDPRFSIGYMDILSIEELKQYYRVNPCQGKRRISLVEIQADSSNWKLCKVVRKQTINKGITQLNLHDGRSLELTKEDNQSSLDIHRNDTIKISIPKQNILEHIPLEVGAWVIIEDGSNIGRYGKLTALEKRIGKYRSIAVIETEGEIVVRTSLEYVFAIGKESPVIEILPPQETETTITTEEVTGESSE